MSVAYEKQSEIWCALRRYPYGATVQQIAGDIGKRPNNIGSRLSKMYAYGFVDRRPMPYGRHKYLYRVKQHLQAAE